MADTIREKILANIETQLKTITKANGYNNNIQLVERYKIDAASVSQLPALFIYDGVDTLESEQSYAYTRTASVEIAGWVRSHDNMSVEANLLLGDTHKCIMADRTRGGYAMETKIEMLDFFIGKNKTVGGFIMTLSVLYRTKPDDPFTAA